MGESIIAVGSYIFSWSFSENDSKVLIIGKHNESTGQVDIVNAFDGEEAKERVKLLHEQFINKKGE